MIQKTNFQLYTVLTLMLSSLMFILHLFQLGIIENEFMLSDNIELDELDASEITILYLASLIFFL